MAQMCCNIYLHSVHKEDIMERPSNRNRLVWVILIIVVLCLIGVLGFFLLFTPLASPPALSPTPLPLLTTEIKISITAAKITDQNGTSSFVVPANTNITIRSNDTNNHSCTIAGGGQSVPIQLSAGNASSRFQLRVGSYRLTCDNNPNRFASITAQ